MKFIRTPACEWINIDSIEIVYIKEYDEEDWEVMCVTKQDEFTLKSCKSQKEAHDWLDNYMQWSVNGG